jgi:drug/metabolite transporter (DMT)-like permease
MSTASRLAAPPAAVAAPPRASRARIVLAFLAIYVIWGSTYLAIRVAIETLPGFLMAGVRFSLAGLILLAALRFRGGPWPSRSEWRSSAVSGTLLLLGGHGAVVWAEYRIASGLAALLIATVPVWMVILERKRPNARTLAGLLLGLGGLAVLFGPDAFGGGEPVDLLGGGAVVVGALLWALGSLTSRDAAPPSSPLAGPALQMIAGGVALLLTGVLTGELSRVTPEEFSGRSIVALLYLITFGSLIGFTAYVWLLRVCPASHVATYAWVNPIVAVLLGAAFAAEPLTPRVALAAAVIVAGVILVLGARDTPRASRR